MHLAHGFVYRREQRAAVVVESPWRFCCGMNAGRSTGCNVADGEATGLGKRHGIEQSERAG